MAIERRKKEKEVKRRRKKKPFNSKEGKETKGREEIKYLFKCSFFNSFPFFV